MENQIYFLSHHSTLVIIFLVSTLFAVVGIIYSKKYQGIENYLTANRNIGVTSLTTSLIASALGSWILSESGILELKNMINSTFITSLFDKSKLSQMIETNNDITKNQGRLWNLMVLSTWHKRNYGR